MPGNHIVLSFFCCAFCINVTAQDIPHFMEKLTREEGLSSNKINDLTQDDNGFLWIATTDGLNRFDGTEVVQYFHNDNSNSISHNYIYCLERLAGNFIAIGTQAGLDFYNSSTGKFVNFYYRQNNSLDEFSNIITRMEIDHNGNLWAASGTCIYIFDKQRQLTKVIPSSFTEADVTRKRLKFAEKMLPLSNGDMLLYLSTGLKIFSSREDKVVDLNRCALFNQLKFLDDLHETPAFRVFDEYTPAANVFKIFDKYFLVIKPSVDSLYLFDEKGKQLNNCYFPYNKYPYILWSQQLSTLDSNNLVFLFHNYGCADIPVSWKDNKPFLHSPPSLLFEEYEYDAAWRDAQGNWWLATAEKGLQKISPGKQYFKADTLIDQLTGQAIKYDINSISQYDHTLWASTYGNGFFEIDLQSGRHEQHFIHTAPSDRWPNFVWNIRQVSSDTLWVGTQAGLFWYCRSKKTSGRIPPYPGKPPSLDSVAITTQFVDSYGWVWMGLGKTHGVCSFDPGRHRFTWYPPNSSQGYPLRYPTLIAEDKKGDLWFVNDASGALVHRERSTGRFELIPLQTSSRKKLSNLSGIWCQDESTIWLGTVTDGLVKFDIPSRLVTIYGHERGLSNNHISSIYEDGEKRLWLVTEGDLSCFDRRSETFTSYSEKDGLPASYPTAYFYYDKNNGRLYTGGSSAVFHFNPDMLRPDPPPQKTIITAMHINGTLLMPEPGKTERFKSWQNDITIQFAAIDLSNGTRTKYAYRLLGEDTGWIMTGSQRQINFSHLAPGNYTFIVRASNSNGVWSDESASVSFYIKPPFTKTAWFYGMVLLATGGLFYGLYRFRLRQLIRTEQIRSEISKNLHDEVGSTLTNISLGTLLAQKQLNDKNSLNRILKRIYEDSQHVSESMREIVWSINPKIDTLGESLPRMLHYASELLEAQDIELKAEITPEIEYVKLNMQQRRDLYMIFKETVNNLAKHSKATLVNIKFVLDERKLVMMVSDNGVGFDTKTVLLTNGIKNMQERAQSNRWKLDIDSALGNGTTITLKAQIA
jgi:ligand-binding sensor domain-containing protein/two-component sensor histidine kinase